MKASLSLFIALVTNLLIFGHSIVFAEIFTEGVEDSPEPVTLKPGEYVWEPERAPEGPLLIVASITEQAAYVCRNGICIARSSVSTGRQGHRTPTGVFTIWKKRLSYLKQRMS
jgi:L,D-transpeptidase catalytic domain